jgi:predicted metal-dependent hydrolase
VSLERGLDLIAARRYYEAHDELEDDWRDAPGPERDFLQGLIHVTVAWHHASRGNAAGAGRQLEKATTRLTPYAPAHRDVELDRVLGQVEAARALVAVGRLDFLPVEVPRERSELG